MWIYLHQKISFLNNRDKYCGKKRHGAAKEKIEMNALVSNDGKKETKHKHSLLHEGETAACKERK